MKWDTPQLCTLMPRGSEAKSQLSSAFPDDSSDDENRASGSADADDALTDKWLQRMEEVSTQPVAYGGHSAQDASEEGEVQADPIELD